MNFWARILSPAQFSGVQARLRGLDRETRSIPKTCPSVRGDLGSRREESPERRRWRSLPPRKRSGCAGSGERSRPHPAESLAGAPAGRRSRASAERRFGPETGVEPATSTLARRGRTTEYSETVSHRLVALRLQASRSVRRRPLNSQLNSR